ncbi:MAG: hypothetical protein M3475_01940 [Actinomycetota bacterium]|nr:hypothetical protein [Actinomycetota bacterium]
MILLSIVGTIVVNIFLRR